MNKHIKEGISNILEEHGIISENEKRKFLEKIESLFNQPKEPISSLLWVPLTEILPNTYNPNKMATPEKRSLLRSLLSHGVTAPLVVSPKRQGVYPLIDGYHRWNIIKRNKELRGRLKNKVPVVVLDLPSDERIVATIRHNRARGKHQIVEISEVVKTLSQNGWTADRIMNELGMDSDEVLRLRQFTGLGDLFKDDKYSSSWS
ncbi:ParB N-terminal domain-containing protein [Poritiphilus flavus]|uniref:ParB N-terminal domain-containing protein n=1 Tax=Poritiphilus flavus TaxID=2697053 RepID=A0A6L9EDY3_9FLAO|nr:ParB N-terminal domain-containing protein [Poritiphilus flavus]NAS12920.1 ParB N-terminal domain-containing protein [Poritiphilus flavus]